MNRYSNVSITRLRATSKVADNVQADSKKEEASRPVLLTSDDSDQLLRIRHSCAHVMAMAVKRLYPKAQCTIGPWIDYGFYYDFDFGGEVITDKDLKVIRKEMRKIVNMDLPFVREEVSREEAERRIEEIGEPYKNEILGDILEKTPDAPITIYNIGDKSDPNHWWDLCAGPHVETTGSIKQDAFDLETLAGAYWRGSEKNQQLVRIYGTAWENKNQLKAYEQLKAEAARSLPPGSSPTQSPLGSRGALKRMTA